MTNQQPSLTADACANCGWPYSEHEKRTVQCPDYSTSDGVHGWLNTRYRRKRLILTESVMTHMLTDLAEIIGEMEVNPEPRSLDDWICFLRNAVDGKDYER